MMILTYVKFFSFSSKIFYFINVQLCTTWCFLFTSRMKIYRTGESTISIDFEITSCIHIRFNVCDGVVIWRTTGSFFYPEDLSFSSVFPYACSQHDFFLFFNLFVLFYRIHSSSYILLPSNFLSSHVFVSIFYLCWIIWTTTKPK